MSLKVYILKQIHIKVSFFHSFPSLCTVHSTVSEYCVHHYGYQQISRNVHGTIEMINNTRGGIEFKNWERS
jgi:hypothetical protein